MKKTTIKCSLINPEVKVRIGTNESLMIFLEKIAYIFAIAEEAEVKYIESPQYVELKEGEKTAAEITLRFKNRRNRKKFLKKL